MYSKEQQALLSRKSSRYERFTARAGYSPVGWSTHRELTLDRIRELHYEVDWQGVLRQKDDTDRKVMRTDGHLQGVDRSRRSAVFQRPLVFKPYNGSSEARIICNFVRQVVDDIDGFTGSVGEMLFANAGGQQAMEVMWRPAHPVPVVTSAGTTAIVHAETVATIEPIYNRYLRHDVVTDRAWIDMGGRTIDPFRDPESKEPTYKVLLHKTFGDGHGRQRGHMFCNHYLSYFKNLSIEKWITVLETYAVPTPYLQMAGSGFTSDEDREDALDALAEHGTGKPAVVHQRWGELKHAPIPSGVDSRGMHAAIIGMICQEQSKVVQGETLTAEIGGVGSYAAMDGHQDQQESVQKIDATMSAETLRGLARFIVAVNKHELSRLVGISPEAVVQLIPRCAWVLDRKIDPVQRLGMFKTLKVDMGMAFDPNQVYDEFYILPPQQEGTPAPTPPAELPAREPDPGGHEGQPDGKPTSEQD